MECLPILMAAIKILLYASFVTWSATDKANLPLLRCHGLPCWCKRSSRGKKANHLKALVQTMKANICLLILSLAAFVISVWDCGLNPAHNQAVFFLRCWEDLWQLLGMIQKVATSIPWIRISCQERSHFRGKCQLNSHLFAFWLLYSCQPTPIHAHCWLLLKVICR